MPPPGQPPSQESPSENASQEAVVRQRDEEDGDQSFALDRRATGVEGTAFEPTLFDLAHSRCKDHHEVPSGTHVKVSSDSRRARRLWGELR